MIRIITALGVGFFTVEADQVACFERIIRRGCDLRHQQGLSLTADEEALMPVPSR